MKKKSHEQDQQQDHEHGQQLGHEQILDQYFAKLLARVENSDLGNAGKDGNGFFQPTRAFLIQRLNMLKDLHRNGKNPQAKAMLKTAWQYTVEHVPPDWLVLNDHEKRALKELLS